MGLARPEFSITPRRENDIFGCCCHCVREQKGLRPSAAAFKILSRSLYACIISDADAGERRIHSRSLFMSIYIFALWSAARAKLKINPPALRALLKLNNFERAQNSHGNYANPHTSSRADFLLLSQKKVKSKRALKIQLRPI